jgi:hypothetical protein
VRIGFSGRALAALTLALACGDAIDDPDAVPPGGSGGCVPKCTGNGNGGTGETGGEDAGFECGEKTLDVEVGESRVLLVLDQSASMGWAWDHDADPNTPDTTRWAVLHELVVWIVQSFANDLQLGVVMFPSATEQCWIDEPIDVPVQADAAQKILGSLPPADTPPDFLETPTVAALEAGWAHLRELDEPGPRAMVLVTDGEPTCNLGLVAAANVAGNAFDEDQIVTYAVGLAVPESLVPGFEAVAEAGGAPSSGDTAFYDVQTQEEFEAALDTITQGLKSCTIALDPEPELPDELKIYIDAEELVHVDDCASESGWVYQSEDGPYDVALMCGDACVRLQTENVKLSADYACSSFTPGE